MSNYILKTDTDSPYTASSDDKILADTTNNPFPIKLPASPSAGNWVEILDISGTFDANPLTIDGNGKMISLPTGNAPTLVDSNRGDRIVLIWATTLGIGGGNWIYYRLALLPQSLRGSWGQ